MKTVGAPPHRFAVAPTVATLVTFSGSLEPVVREAGTVNDKAFKQRIIARFGQIQEKRLPLKRPGT